MEDIFNALVDSYVENKVGIANNFLGISLAANLKANLMGLYKDRLMTGGGTGNELIIAHDKLVRSDVIYWLDKTHNNPFENDFFELMDRFVLHLNHTCYTGITGYEFHYTLYEQGSFYQKHIDQFQHNGKRAFSMVMYLNDQWKSPDGGELCIHHEFAEQRIEPLNGRSVFFKSSELVHEVLITNKPRLSITGWLKVS